MEELWKVAIGVAGLGAVGAFVFWSLYKHWIKLPIFANLTKEQTFRLMLAFLFLTFFALVVIVAAYVYTHHAASPPTSSSVTNLSYGEIETIPQPVNQREPERATFRLPLLNNGTQVVSLIRGQVNVIRATFRKGRPPFLMKIDQLNHDHHIPVTIQDPHTGQEIPFDVSFALTPNKGADLLLWLKTPVDNSKEPGFYDLSFNVTLFDYNGGAATTKPLDASLYTGKQ